MCHVHPYSSIDTPEALLSHFLPEYRQASVAYVNLDMEARLSVATGRMTTAQATQLADANVCAGFVEELHKRLGVVASFGGYLEDRAFLWQGTYLGNTEKTVHLGIDFNAPQGSVVATPVGGTVIRCDNDHPDRWGWGPRVFIETDGTSSDPTSAHSILLFAHLAEISVRVGDVVMSGSTLGVIGTPPFNGDWFPHLHVQQVRRELYDTFMRNDPWALDGYGDRSAMTTFTTDFPDPILSHCKRSTPQVTKG